MNRYVKIALAALCLLAAVSCRKDSVPCVTSQSFLIDVPQSSWNYSFADNNNCFYASVDAPEITEYVFDHAVVKLYRTFDYYSANAYQIELPYVRQNEYCVEDEEGREEWLFYTEALSSEISIGRINLVYTVSDFEYELHENPLEAAPEAMTFRCVILCD